jgi:hypothetical protein
VRAAHRLIAAGVVRQDHSTVIFTDFDAMPLAMTTSSLAPVSVAADTVKVVEPAVPGAIDIVL